MNKDTASWSHSAHSQNVKCGHSDAITCPPSMCECNPEAVNPDHTDSCLRLTLGLYSRYQQTASPAACRTLTGSWKHASPQKKERSAGRLHFARRQAEVHASIKKKTKRNMVSETCFSVGSVADLKKDWAGTHELWERHQEAH